MLNKYTKIDMDDFTGIISILILLVLVDSIYLYFTKDIFGALIVKIQRVSSPIRYVGAGIVYVLLAIALWIFIVKKQRPLWEAALLGACIYGVFDFTNYAMLKNYDLNVAMMDTAWGAVLLTIATYIIRKF